MASALAGFLEQECDDALAARLRGEIAAAGETGWARFEFNLFDLELYQGLAALSHELAADDAVRVVVLRSANPDFFIAHFDVGLITATRQGSGSRNGKRNELEFNSADMR